MAASSNWRAVLGVAVLVSVIVVGPAAAVADPDPGKSPVSRRGLSPNKAMLERAAKEAEQQYIDYRVGQQARKATDKVAARRQTRTAFAGMSRDEAGRLARQQFPELVTKPAQGPFTRGKQADGYTGDYSGWVKGAGKDGANAMVVGAQPLRTKNAAGELAPVDSRLTGSSADGWAPRNPLEPYRLAGQSTGAVTFSEQDLTVTPGGESVAGVAQDETILYANTQTDTDTLVKPLTDGVEYLWQLRSADSPTSLTLNVSLPDGARLGQPGPAGVDIVKDGKPIGRVGTPVAADADGQLVDTKLAVKGDTVTVSVAHRDKDVAYPIMVDPPVYGTFYFTHQGTGDATPADPYYYWGKYAFGAFDVYGGDGPYGRGLHIGSSGYPTYRQYSISPTLDHAGMYYEAPGDASIYYVYNTLSRHILGEYAICMVVGMAGHGVNNWEGTKGYSWGEGCAPFAAYGWTINDDAPSPGNDFVFSVQAWNPDTTQSQTVLTAFQSYFADAEIRMTDPDDPGISSFGVPAGWTNGTHGEAVNVLAGDYSTGVRNINVVNSTGAEGWSNGGAYMNPNCLYGPCTKQLSVSLPIGDMVEGTNTINVVAVDPSGRSSGVSSKDVHVDKTAPLINTSGEDMSSAGLPITFSSGDVEFTATDEEPEEGMGSAGVARVQISIDGQSRYDTSQDCSSACPTEASDSITVDNVALGDGDHQIDITATDGAGNVSTESETITITHLTPQLVDNVALDSSSGPQWIGAGGEQAGASIANVGDIDGDGQADTLVGAPGSTAGGTNSGAAYLVFGDNATSNVTLGDTSTRASGGLRSLRLTGGANDQAGTAVAAAGDVNGDGSMDLLVGAPGTQSLGTRQGRVYVVFGSATLASPSSTPVDLTSLGAGGFRITGPVETGLPAPPVIGVAPGTFGGQLATRRLENYAVDGDINGDDLDDIVIGDAATGTTTRPGGGTTYVIFGKTTTSAVDLAASGGSPGSGGFRIFGSAAGSRTGEATAMIGDLNGDDLADVLVAAPGEQTTKGVAYAVFGKTGASDVDLASLGTGGFAITGAAGDRLSSVGSVGDVNGDNVDDLLVGGHNAALAYGQAVTDPIDLSASFDGYKINAPSADPTYDRGTVGGIGDMDADHAPDFLVRYPDAQAGAGEAYVVYGRIEPETVNLAAPRGDQAARLRSASGSGLGRGADGTDAGINDEPAMRLGSPGMSRVYGSVASSHLKMGRRVTRCQGNNEWPFWWNGTSDFAHAIPTCRRAQRGTLDVPLIPVLNSPHGCTPKLGSGCVRTVYRGGNARIQLKALDTTQMVPLKDSFGHTMLQIRQTTTGGGCFRVYDAGGTFVGDTHPDGCYVGSGTTQPRKYLKSYQVAIELQGQACMATSALQDDYWMIRLAFPRESLENSDYAKGPYPNYVGIAGDSAQTALVQGFIDRDDLKLSSKNTTRQRQIRLANLATPGCAMKARRKTAGAVVDLGDSPRFADGGDGNGPVDRYQSPHAIETRCKDALRNSASCGAPYANYQSPSFAPGYTMVTSSTTAVSGDKSQPGAGGIVRAIIPRGNFRRFDYTGAEASGGQLLGYADPNVPCGHDRVAVWWFGDGNASPGNGEKHLYGWVAARLHNPLPPDLLADPNYRNADGQIVCGP